MNLEILKINEQDFQIVYPASLLSHIRSSATNTPEVLRRNSDHVIQAATLTLKTIKRSRLEFDHLQQYIKCEYPHYLIYYDTLETFIDFLNSSLNKQSVLVAGDVGIQQSFGEILTSEGFIEFLTSEFTYKFKGKPKNASGCVEIDEYFNLELEKTMKLLEHLGEIKKKLDKVVDVSAKAERKVSSSMKETVLLHGIDSLLILVEQQIKIQNYKLIAFNYRQRWLISYSSQIQRTKSLVEKISSLKNSRTINEQKVTSVLEELQVEKVEEGSRKYSFMQGSLVLKASLKRVRLEENEMFIKFMDAYADLNFSSL